MYLCLASFDKPLLCMSVVHFFVLLSSFALCEYNIVRLSIYLLIDIWIVSRSWKLRIELLTIFMCKIFFGHVLSVFLDK